MKSGVDMGGTWVIIEGAGNPKINRKPSVGYAGDQVISMRDSWKSGSIVRAFGTNWLDTRMCAGSPFSQPDLYAAKNPTHSSASPRFSLAGSSLRSAARLDAQSAAARRSGGAGGSGDPEPAFQRGGSGFRRAKNTTTAVAKIQELLEALGPNKDAPLELLYFNIGLGYLLGEKPAEAEAAFTECLKRFPKGEYASRCYLGVGRACILQDTPEKKERAIEALKIAALDPKYRSEAGLWLGEVYTDLGKHEEALVVFKSLMGSDIRSPQQTTAAVEVIGLLAETGKLEDLILYLDRLSNQAGVRDAIAWYANQVIVRATNWWVRHPGL